MLHVPNLDSSIQNDAYLTLLTGPYEYEKCKKVPAIENDKVDYNQYINDVYIINEIKNDLFF